MKKLHLIRHAKSSWSDDTLADIDRPLNQRGRKDCPVMAEQIAKAGCTFDHVFCSPAVRAQNTIEYIAQHLDQQNTSAQNITWQVDHALYTFEAAALLTWCQALNESMTEVVVVGHNNAITDLVTVVGDHEIANVPTCGYVQLALKNSTWKTLSKNSAEVLSFLRPKMFM